MRKLRDIWTELGEPFELTTSYREMYGCIYGLVVVALLLGVGIGYTCHSDDEKLNVAYNSIRGTLP